MHILSCIHKHLYVWEGRVIMECENCNNQGYVLSNNEKEEKDLQKCDTCQTFVSDCEAKLFVLDYIKNKGRNK